MGITIDPKLDTFKFCIQQWDTVEFDGAESFNIFCNISGTNIKFWISWILAGFRETLVQNELGKSINSRLMSTAELHLLVTFTFSHY